MRDQSLVFFFSLGMMVKVIINNDNCKEVIIFQDLHQEIREYPASCNARLFTSKTQANPLLILQCASQARKLRAITFYSSPPPPNASITCWCYIHIILVFFGTQKCSLWGQGPRDMRNCNVGQIFEYQ